MTRLPYFLLLSFLFSVANVLFANAATISLEGVRRGSGAMANGLARRAGIVDLQNHGDLEYYTNMTLGGRSYRVLLDGGSADLWVAGKVPESVATPHVVTIHYEDAYVLGKVNTATLQFAGVTIINQSYVEQVVDASHPEGLGILGIGASRLSFILSALSAPAGNTVIDNLIKVEGTGSNFVTSLVSRPVESSGTVFTKLTIGEVDSDYLDVQSAAQLPVSKNGWDSHWLVSLDEGGIIGPDKLVIRASKDNQLKVIFDSGYTMSQVPEAIAAAIYSRVPGAKLATMDVSPSPVWTLPCDFELNITFKFGGVAYPMHPLDTVMRDIVGPADDQGSATCVGAFQPSNASSPYDILLGMTFLRNAYILMNLGDQPYVQLRSLTDPAEAHLDFVQRRLDGVDTTSSQQLLDDGTGLSDNSTPDSSVDKDRVFIIAGTVIGTFVALAGVGVTVVWYLKRRYRRRHAVTLAAALPPDSSETSPASKDFMDPEPKSPLRILTLPFSVYSKHRSALAMSGRFPSPQEKSRSAVARKTSAGYLIPNQESFKAQSVLTVARRSSIGVLKLPGVETASSLGNLAASAVKPVPGPRYSQSAYAREDGPILIIGEKPLPVPTSDNEEDPRPQPKSQTDSAEVSLGSSKDRWRLTSSYGVTLPSTPATFQAPARSDTPDPYDLPPFPPPELLADPSPRPWKANLSRPLPNPYTMPGNRRHSRVTISAFESLFGRAASRRPKRSPAPSIATSTFGGTGAPSPMLGGKANPGSESKVSSRTFSLRRSRGKP